MNKDTSEKKYKDLGLETRIINDGPGEVYEPHRHEGVYLLTLDGSARIKLDDGEWRTVVTGDEVRIHDNQLHEAVSGPKGWQYLFAASPEEVKRQGL